MLMGKAVFPPCYLLGANYGGGNEDKMKKLQRWRNSIQSAKTRPGDDCGSDHALLIVKFRLKLKKVGETTRPLRYDLNQTPYDYTVEVRNRLKGLDLIECLKNYGQRFMTLYRKQGSRPSQRKEMQKGKMVSGKTFQITEKR